MSAPDIFDFETIVPAAVKPVLLDAGLVVWIIGDDPKFQKVRPRVEVVYNNGGETKPRRTVFLPDGTKRGSAFFGELRIHAITDADPPGKSAHAIYRGQVRNLLAGLQDAINGVTLNLHKIQWLEPGKEVTGIRTQDNYQQTTFPFQVMISIQRNAWAKILT